jgi:Leucine-rich repeat (LRR) protein
MSLHGLPRLSQLRELNVSSNELVTCDLLELSQLPSLRSLDLSANRIDSLLALPFLPGLRSLSVAFNNLSSLGCGKVDYNGLIYRWINIQDRKKI